MKASCGQVSRPGLGDLEGFSRGTCILTACVDPVHSDDIGGSHTGRTETKLTGFSLSSSLRLLSVEPTFLGERLQINRGVVPSESR
jgi:hypothetical protein